MRPEIKLPTYEVEAGSEGTGFKSGNAGEYRTYVYGKIRRKYVKVIITADVRTKKLLAVDVKIGEVSEPKVAAKHIKLLKENGIKLKKFYGDGAYDTEIFNVIGEAESAVKIRKNATTYRCRGRRRQEVRKYMKLGYKTWAKKVKYGLRWAIEGIFSSIKRKFGEDLRARSVIGLLAEAMQKVWAYDIMVSYAKNAMLMA
jgi:Transposase DDE domain.